MKFYTWLLFATNLGTGISSAYVLIDQCETLAEQKKICLRVEQASGPVESECDSIALVSLKALAVGGFISVTEPQAVCMRYTSQQRDCQPGLSVTPIKALTFEYRCNVNLMSLKLKAVAFCEHQCLNVESYSDIGSTIVELNVGCSEYKNVRNVETLLQSVEGCDIPTSVPSSGVTEVPTTRPPTFDNSGKNVTDGPTVSGEVVNAIIGAVSSLVGIIIAPFTAKAAARTCRKSAKKRASLSPTPMGSARNPTVESGIQLPQVGGDGGATIIQNFVGNHLASSRDSRNT